MQYRTVPQTDLVVSLLGFGNFVFGTNWWGDFSDEQAIELQNAAVDLGVTFFDTAPAYGNGRAEALLKPTIDYAGRENLVVSTKFGYDLIEDPGTPGSHRERKQNFSAQAVRSQLETSLQRLGIDHIDLYQAHNLKLPNFSDEMFQTLDNLREEGKIRAWGAALGPAIGWREEGYQAFLDHHANTVQTVFNLYEQDPGREFCELAVPGSVPSDFGQDDPGAETQANREAVADANDADAANAEPARGGVIARVPTNSGILDEEFSSPDHQFPEHDHRKFRDRDWLVYGLQKNQIIQPIAQRLGMSIRELAIRWLSGQRAVVSIEPNILSQADLKDYAHACDGKPLPDDLLGELARLYDRDFDLGEAAHPCNLKSSTAAEGSVTSGYLSPSLT